jgi:hypothetical protein
MEGAYRFARIELSGVGGPSTASLRFPRSRTGIKSQKNIFLQVMISSFGFCAKGVAP